MDSADLAALFRFGVDPLEIFVRGSAVYWLLFLLFRFVLRRDIGSIGVADMLLLMLLSDAAQNAMSGGYETVTDGALLISTIAGWNWLIDWSAYRSATLRQLLEPPAVVLVRNGQPLWRNMRREMIGREELMSKLHQNGIENLADVEVARMESSGEISVTRRQQD